MFRDRQKWQIGTRDPLVEGSRPGGFTSAWTAGSRPPWATMPPKPAAGDRPNQRVLGALPKPGLSGTATRQPIWASFPSLSEADPQAADSVGGVP
jgi:hypothetical protein